MVDQQKGCQIASNEAHEDWSPVMIATVDLNGAIR
jgi:hypothetical protein